MGLPTFSMATHFKMVAPGGQTKNAPTLTNDNMASDTASGDNSNSSQRPPPTFDGLPTELKKLVVNHAEDSCLANLRLVNKELNAITIKPFGERLLVERRFILSKHSLQGLVDLTAHPVFGPCVRKVLLHTHRLADKEIDKWCETKGEHMSRGKRDRIQAILREFKEIVHNDMIIDFIKQARRNLNKYGNQVTFGVFDDVVYVEGHKLLRKAYGFDEHWGEISPLHDLEPNHWFSRGEITLVALGTAMDTPEFNTPPLEFDLKSAIRTPHGCLDHLLFDLVITGDGELKRDVDVCIKAGLDSTFRVSSPDAAHRRLILDYQGTTTETRREDEVHPRFVPKVIGWKESEPRYHYGAGTCSLFSMCMLGDFKNAIDKGNVSEIRIASCATEADVLVFSICHVGRSNLQHLVLADLHLFGHGCRRFVDGKGSAWPYVQGIRGMLSYHCPNLRSLVMERVTYHVEDTYKRTVLVGERREWKGVNGVLSGLVSLMSEMTTLDEEQRERWMIGEIDADGNDIVEGQWDDYQGD